MSLIFKRINWIFYKCKIESIKRKLQYLLKMKGKGINDE